MAKKLKQITDDEIRMKRSHNRNERRIVDAYDENERNRHPGTSRLYCVQGRHPSTAHGLSKLSGEQVIHRTDFMVAAVIVTYNMFMNAVDRMDQHRSSNPTRRREKRFLSTIHF